VWWDSEKLYKCWAGCWITRNPYINTQIFQWLPSGSDSNILTYRRAVGWGLWIPSQKWFWTWRSQAVCCQVSVLVRGSICLCCCVCCARYYASFSTLVRLGRSYIYARMHYSESAKRLSLRSNVYPPRRRVSMPKESFSVGFIWKKGKASLREKELVSLLRVATRLIYMCNMPHSYELHASS